MFAGRTVFAQLVDHLSPYEFQKCVARYGGDSKFRGFSCLDQLLCLAFAQLTFRESLRDIEACLRSVESKLYHMGFRGKVSRSTLADANEAHDWRIYADFAQVLIHIARPLYANESLGFDLDNTVYALDSTTIDLCLSVFPWARFRARKAAVKMHTLLDLRGPIPTFIEVSEGKLHDVNILDAIVPEPGSFYVMDRAYVDFERLHVFHCGGAFFVTRTKRGVLFRRRYSHPVDCTTGLRSDHTVVLASAASRKHYPDPLRRIHYHDAEQDRSLRFLTNNFDLPALTICLLYKSRWQVELFFKWIKQHLRIKAFYGYSENAVKTQIWIAVSVYVLVAVLKKRLGLQASLHEILQVLSVTLFEQVPVLQALREIESQDKSSPISNQLTLWDL
ncbi:MAG: IS4 family transposase [Bryobacteraceae bacterium]